MKIIIYLPEKQEIEVNSMDANMSNEEVFQELIGNPKEFVVLGNIAVNKSQIIAVRILPEDAECKKECAPASEESLKAVDSEV